MKQSYRSLEYHVNSFRYKVFVRSSLELLVDSFLMSPYKIDTMPSTQVMKIKEIISWGMLSRCAIKITITRVINNILDLTLRDYEIFANSLISCLTLLITCTSLNVFLGFVLNDLHCFLSGENKTYWSITVCSRWLVISL